MNTQNCDCDYLHNQIGQLEREQREMELRDEERRKADSERRKRERLEELRSARDWPAAFSNQLVLIRPEIHFASCELAKHENGHYKFSDDEERERSTDCCKEDLERLLKDRRAIERARVLYAEEQKRIADQIEALQAGARERVAAKLEEEKWDGDFATELVRHLRDNDPEGWLDW